ncbi:MAG: TIGR00366 family protein [Lachnospiraceae bacterium]|nr:TIGR00366 family protein [Lachnospiraceae bacterium]
MIENNHEQELNPIARMGNVLLRFSMKYMPDASIFAVLITVVAFAAGVLLTSQGPVQMMENWYRGFWELLTFSMQMSLIVVTGSAVANSPAIKKGIRRIAKIPGSGAQAVGLVAFLSILISYLHWGLSLIVSALLAREVAGNLRRRNIYFEYGLIAAAAYVGQMTWQGALSSSIGLSIASSGHILESEMGIIPMSRYMGNMINIVTSAALLVFPPLFAMMMHPKKEGISPLEPMALEAIEKEDAAALTIPENPSVGDRLNYSFVIAGIFGIMGWIYIVYAFAEKGFSALDINMVNFIFLFSGLLLHRNIANYVRAVGEAVSGAAGIIFQFPLYAGIQGIIKYSGLVGIMSSAIAAVSTPATFYLWIFFGSAVISIFVPSGGGQWMVLGPIAIASAKMLGADLIKTSLMVGYGHTWINMFQPFWAIALLGITGLKAKDIMGYSTAIMFCGGVIYILTSFLPV